MRWTAVLLLVLAGCASPPAADIEVLGEPSGEMRSQDEYWFVFVHGTEERSPPPGYMCSVAWSWSHDVASREIRFSTAAPLDNHVTGTPVVLIGTAVWGPGDCPIDNRLTDRGNVTIASEVLGGIAITAHDGSVSAAGQTIVPGQSIILSGERRDGATVTTTSIEIEFVGAWPLTGLIEER